MIRILVSVMLLSAVVCGQPLEGPWTVVQSTAGECRFSNMHFILGADEMIDIFYGSLNSNDSLRQVRHLQFSTSTHEVQNEETLVHDGRWTWTIEDVVRDDASSWFLAISGRREMQDGNPNLTWATKTLLQRGASTLAESMELHNGIEHTSRPMSTDQSMKPCVFTHRLGGGVAIAAIHNGWWDMGQGFCEPDQMVLLNLYESGTLQPDHEFLSYAGGFWPNHVLITSFHHDSVYAMVESDLAVLPTEESPRVTPVVCHIAPLCISRTQGGRLLCLSRSLVTWPEHDSLATRITKLNPEDGSCEEISPIGVDRDPDAIAFHPDFGYASLFVSPTNIQLSRADTNGIQSQPVGTFLWADTTNIVEATLRISNNGTIFILWSDRLPDSTHAFSLHLAAVDWTTPLEVKDPQSCLHPTSINLSSFPNPFNNEVRISYDLPHSQTIELAVYNVLGQKVETLFAGRKSSGTFSTVWQPRAGTGVYFVSLNTDNVSATKKILFLK